MSLFKFSTCFQMFWKISHLEALCCQTQLLQYVQIVGHTAASAHLCFVRVCIVRLMEAEVGGQGWGSLPAARESCFCFLLFSQLTSCLWPGLGDDRRSHFRRCTLKYVIAAGTRMHAHPWPWMDGDEKPIQRHAAAWNISDCASAHTENRDIVPDQSSSLRWRGSSVYKLP